MPVDFRPLIERGKDAHLDHFVSQFAKVTIRRLEILQFFGGAGGHLVRHAVLTHLRFHRHHDVLELTLIHIRADGPRIRFSSDRAANDHQ